MGFFSKFMQGHKRDQSQGAAVQFEADPWIIYAPVGGKTIPLDEVPDQFFASGIMGLGCGIKPDESIIRSPVSGTIISTFPAGQAYGIETDNGMEVLVHIGDETAYMGDLGFTHHAKQNQTVKAGDVLVEIDRKALQKNGIDDTVLVTLTNASDFRKTKVLKPGKSAVRNMEPVIQITK